MKKAYPFLIFFLIFISLRIVHLSADPPDNLSPTSGGEYGDPGNYAFNARNKVIFGQWKVDDFNIMYLSPLPHVFTYLSFTMFGPGIWQMNLVPFFFSLLLFIALYFLSSKYFPQARWLFFFLLLVNYPFGIYSRIADRIMPMTFFAVLATFFFLKAWENAKYFFLSSLFLCFSFFSKGKIIYFHVLVIPLSFLLILIQRKELLKIKLNFRRLLYFLAGAALGFIPWYFLLYSPHKILFARMSTINMEAMFPSRIFQALSNWLERPPFSFYHTNLLLSFLLFFYFLFLLLRLFNRTNRSRVSPLEIICSVWLMVGFAVNSLIGYRPIRHYIEFTIPLLILLSIFLSRLASGFRLKIDLKMKILFFFSLFLLIWVCVTSYPKNLQSFLRILKIDTSLYNLLWLTMALALGLSLLVYFLIHFFLSFREIILPKKLAVLCLTLLVGIYSFQNAKEFALWVRQATYNLKTISRDLGKAFPQAVFCGLLAPTIGLENKNRVYTSWKNFINDDPLFLKQKKVTHFFLATYNQEPNHYLNHFPEEWKKAKFLVRYRIWRSWFLLYEIKEEKPCLPETLAWEAEKMERELGQPRFDPQASNRFSVYVASKKRGMIGQDGFQAIAPGKHKGKLFIKIKEFKRGAPLLFLTVLRKGKIISKKTLYASAFSAKPSENYESLSFDFFLPEQGEYELTIVCNDNSVLYFDRIDWEKGLASSEIPFK